MVVEQRVKEYGIIPVVVLNTVDKAVALGKALIHAGLPCAEITFRTEAAAESIQLLSQVFPEMLIGAGTVLSISQVKQAKAAGAEFMVSPGFDPEVVDYCIDKKIPIFPGCVTPSDVSQAAKRNLKIVKFFPAEQYGGISAIKAIAAPFPEIKFLPTGGINEKNVREYLRYNKVVACGGSWMVKKELIEMGEFGQITELTRHAVLAVKEVRCC